MKIVLQLTFSSSEFRSLLNFRKNIFFQLFDILILTLNKLELEFCYPKAKIYEISWAFLNESSLKKLKNSRTFKFLEFY